MLLLLLHPLVFAILLMRRLHLHTVHVLVLRRYLLLWIEGFVGLWLHHELLLFLDLLLILAVLNELLCKLLLVLLRDKLAQLLIAKQNIVQFLLVPVCLSFHLLLLFPSCSDFSCACIDCRLDTRPLLGEALLACIVEVDRSAVGASSSFHTTCLLDVGHDLSDADLELLFLRSQLVQFFD